MSANSVSQATDSTTATLPNSFDAQQAQMLEMQRQNQAFQMVAQEVSAQMTAAGTATNLITSAHSAAGNIAKAIGQGMVESSRR